MATLGATLSSDTTWNGVRLGAHASDETYSGQRFGGVPSNTTFSPGGNVTVIAIHAVAAAAIATGSHQITAVPPGPCTASAVARVPTVVSGASTVTATRPTAPSTYTLPGSFTSVSTSSALVAALQSSTVTTILVEDGIYTNAAVVSVGAAHQVYARHLFGAEIQFGIVGGQFANTIGFRVQGLYFHVTNPAATFSSRGNQVHIWAANSKAWQILDCKFLGNDSMQNAVVAESNASLEGLIIRRCEARNFHANGYRIDSNDKTYTLAAPPILEDLYAENCCWQTNPAGSDGQAESGLWLGCRATLNRMWAHQTDTYATTGPYGGHFGWQGLWLGVAARDMTINDLLVTGKIAVGCYGYGPLNQSPSNPSVSSGTFITVNRMETAPPVVNGWHQEWNGSAHTPPQSYNVIVQDSYLNTTCTGWDVDDGTCSSTVRRTRFVGQTGAATVNYNQGASPNLYDTAGNDYTGILPGAVVSSTAHALDAFPCYGFN